MKVNWKQIATIGYDAGYAYGEYVKARKEGKKDLEWYIAQHDKYAESAWAIRSIMGIDAYRVSRIALKWEKRHSWQRLFPEECLQRLCESMMND